ncbi:MAG TPA: TetR family transcriptional regulator, partial [Bacteroidetes bacterium]|nr:TetR family transcriptional regulator [Bacteroidota bacterium]
MGIKQRKEREKEEMKKFILDAAMKLFLKDGYENVSIR